MTNLKEFCAKIAHEVNRVYCISIGDNTQPVWEQAPDWQKQSALNGVEFHLKSEFSPEESHNNWLKEKYENGWGYGPVKDPELKQHPCMLPYSELPSGQKTKDYLFKAVVNAFKPIIKE